MKDEKNAKIHVIFTLMKLRIIYCIWIQIKRDIFANTTFLYSNYIHSH